MGFHFPAPVGFAADTCKKWRALPDELTRSLQKKAHTLRYQPDAGTFSPLLLQGFRSETWSPMKIKIPWCGWGLNGKERAGVGFITPLSRFTYFAVNIVIFSHSLAIGEDWGFFPINLGSKSLSLLCEICDSFLMKSLPCLAPSLGRGLGNWMSRSDILHFTNLLHPPWSGAFCHLGSHLEALTKGKSSLTSKLSKAFMNKSPEVLVSLITEPNFPVNVDPGVCYQALLLGITNSCSCLLCLP